MAIKGLSLFLSISITAGGRVSRFFSRNPVASYSTCGSQHRIEYKKEWDFSLPRPNSRRHQFSPHETTVSVSKFVKSGTVVSLSTEKKRKLRVGILHGEVKTTESYLLSPGQTIKTFQHNISQHSGWPSICWPNSGQTIPTFERNISQHYCCSRVRHVARVWPPYRLRHVGCFCL